MNFDKKVSEYWKRFNKKTGKLNSFMNNSKWKKLFETLSENKIYRIEIKFILNEHICEISIGEDYFNEIGFGDNNATGPFEYKQIEWIRLSEKTVMEKNGNRKIYKTVKEMEEIIKGIGKYKYEKDENGIKIYGYKK